MKRHLIRVLLNYLTINLFGLLPFLLALNLGTSDVLRVEFYSGTSVEVNAASERCDDGSYNFNRVAAIEEDNGRKIAKLSYPDGFPKREFALKFVGAKLDVKIHSIALIKNSFFKRVLDTKAFAEKCLSTANVELADVDDGSVCISSVGNCIFATTDFSHQGWGYWSLTMDGIEKKWHKRIPFLQLLLVVISVGFAFYRDNWTKRRNVKDSFVVAIGISAFVGVLLPLQIYLSNKATYTFPLFALLWDCCLLSILIFIVSWVSLYVMGRCFGRWPHVMTAAFLVYEYFLVGPLMAGAPSLNGGIAFFGTPELIYRDFAVLGAILVMFVIGYHWLKNRLIWCISAFLAMCCATVADSAINPAQGKSSSPREKHSVVEIARSIKHSPRRNIYVICLDSVRGDVAAKVIRENKDLLDSFKGFTLFSNNVGMYPVTIYGMPGFMLGRYANNGEKPEEYMDAIVGEESFISPYLKACIPTWFLMGTPRHMFTNQLNDYPQSSDTADDAIQAGGLHWRPDTIPPLTILEVIRFKLTPFWYKGTVLGKTGMAASDTKTFKRETVLFPFIENASVDETLDCTLQCYHTYGTHSPINIDRDGNYVTKGKDGDKALEDMTYFILKRTGELLGELKRKGVYDNSFIMLIADHGNIESSHPVFGRRDVLGYAVPLLMIKPIGFDLPYRESEVATSHIKVHDLMVSTFDKDLSDADVMQHLKVERRKFINQESYYKLSGEIEIDDSGVLCR